MIEKYILLICSAVLIGGGIRVIITKSFTFKNGIDASPVGAIVIGVIVIIAGICLLLFCYHVLADKKKSKDRNDDI